jgi:adenine-specific DNA-methyltransferase
MTNKLNPKFQELVAKLREIFQIDRPELDFGIYRILNARAGEINDYLQNRLAEKVQAALSAGSAASAQQLQAELQEAEKNAQALGVSPDAVPKVQELRAKLKEATAGSSEHENAVFSHLLAFFSRYYEQGDFISQRRYKGDTYAIPYAGEEVMLHWANKDQYYTKSGENFSNYSFTLEDGRTVHFRLASADTAKDNRKDNDKERRFALVAAKTVTRLDENGDEYEEELVPVEEASGSDGNKDLIIRFEYAAQPKGTKQEALVTKAVEAVLADAAVKARWLALGNRAPTEKNPQRTLLEKHLSDYTTKNTADYFIHKDLGGFLRRELDFYIKNEVMHLDDVQNARAFADIEKNLRMIQCLRSIALELISFLAHLEDFQKKLWLKKKFVVSSHYCITLDQVPDSLWEEVAKNSSQLEEWGLGSATQHQDFLTELGGRSEIESLEFKKANHRLVLDTRNFPETFKARLLASIENLDEACKGVLVYGDNFQALQLIGEKYKSSIKAVYLDPPYNTGEADFFYKDRYQHSSWLAFMSNRLSNAIPLLGASSSICVSIDDNESGHLRVMLDEVFGKDKFVADIAYERSGISGLGQGGKIVNTKEHILAYSFSKADLNDVFYEREIEQKTLKRYAKYLISPGKRSRVDSFIAPSTGEEVVIYKHEAPEIGSISLRDFEDRKSEIMSDYRKHFDKIYRLTSVQAENEFQQKILRICGNGFFSADYLVSRGRHKGQMLTIYYANGQILVWLKDSARLAGSQIVKANKISDHWSHVEIPKADLANEGGVTLQRGKKPEQLLKRLVDWMSGEDDIILDYFGGTATTGAVALKTGRRFLLTEAEGYFYEKTLFRLKNVLGGDKTGISSLCGWTGGGMFKYVVLESYEDTLNNLQLRRTAAQGDLLNTLPQQAKDDYLLNYLLDVESRGSLLSVEDFKKPFHYTLNVAVDSAGAFEPRKIDLVETFNYLLGLRVKHIDSNMEEGYVRVEGTLPSGESTLVIWRDCEKINYDTLKRYGNRFDLEGENNPFDVIYINGDHNTPAIYAPTEGEEGQAWVRKIRQIEPEFLERMFSVEDV